MLTVGCSLFLWGLPSGLAVPRVLAQSSDVLSVSGAKVSLAPSVDGLPTAVHGHQSDALEAGVLETGALETGALEAAALEVSVLEVGALKVGALKVGALKVGALSPEQVFPGLQDALLIQEAQTNQAPFVIDESAIQEPQLIQGPQLIQDSQAIQEESPAIQEPSPIELVAIKDVAAAVEQMLPSAAFSFDEFPQDPAPLLLAAPYRFNPDRYQPPPEPEPEPPSPADLDFGVDTRNGVELEVVPAELETMPQQPSEPLLTIDDVEFDFGDSLSNVGQGGQTNEPLIRGTLRNGTPVVFAPGYNTFVLPGSEDVNNFPLRFGWQEKIKDIPINIMGGIETFDRLRPAPYLKLSATIPIRQRAVMSFEVEHGPYKFNVETLEKAISHWRYGPSLFWQLGSNTTVFSMVRWGRYSDGNREQQSFSRIEYKPGEFSAALNVFNWRYLHDYGDRSGYFSPNDFLVISGELAWEKRISDVAKCRLAGTLGKQHAARAWANAYSYDMMCTLKPFDDIEFDVGYSFSNTLDQATGRSASNSRSIKGQIRIVN